MSHLLSVLENADLSSSCSTSQTSCSASVSQTSCMADDDDAVNAAAATELLPARQVRFASGDTTLKPSTSTGLPTRPFTLLFFQVNFDHYNRFTVQ